MDMNSHPVPVSTAENIDPMLIARALGELLLKTPEYEAYVSAHKTLHSDLAIQKLAAEMRAHRTALQWGRDSDGQHAAEVTRLELELEDLPIMKAYHQAEDEVCRLFRAVDEIIGREAGVDFAVNAQRSGCGCGG